MGQSKYSGHKSPGILELLEHGSENAVNLGELSKRAGMNKRETRRTIAALRKSGVVILSSVDDQAGGYFLPDKDEEKGQREIRRFYRQMVSRATEILAAAEPARLFLEGAENE